MLLITHTPVLNHALSETVPRVDLSPATEEGTYFIARIIMSAVDWVLHIFGLEHDETLFTCIYAVLVFLLAWGVGWVVKGIVVLVVRKIGRHWNSSIYSKLRQADFFSKVCRIIPAVLFLILLQFTLTTRQTLSMWLTRVTWIYIVYVVVVAASVFATVMWLHFDERDNTRKLPLKGLLQLVKGVIWILGTIVVVAILLDKSPGSLLAGLGVFASVLMLVFKDSILGLVAGVQLSQNDSLHVGDWIKVHGTNANGTVEEVNLTAVRVLNWDKTTTYLPPYSLVSGGFTSYRSMQVSNTREIVRSYYVDADSVVAPDEAMLDLYETLPLVGEWVRKKRAQKVAGKVEDVENSEGLVDGSLDTNLGIFRAYIKLYLDSHPRVQHGGDRNFCFVTTLPQTANGIPLQITCFTDTSAWLTYESIMAGIFEHLAMMLHYFNLYTFEAPSGRDTIIDGFLSPGKNPALMFGLPYPFYNGGGTPHNPAWPVPPVPASGDAAGGTPTASDKAPSSVSKSPLKS